MKRYKAIITERAQQDVIHAKSYYDSLQPGLGNRFLKLFRDKIRAIREVPFAHAIRYHNVRFAHLDNFPRTSFNISLMRITLCW